MSLADALALEHARAHRYASLLAAGLSDRWATRLTLHRYPISQAELSVWN